MLLKQNWQNKGIYSSWDVASYLSFCKFIDFIKYNWEKLVNNVVVLLS